MSSKNVIIFMHGNRLAGKVDLYYDIQLWYGAWLQFYSSSLLALILSSLLKAHEAGFGLCQN
jgi:hypothetical protein